MRADPIHPFGCPASGILPASLHRRLGPYESARFQQRFVHFRAMSLDVQTQHILSALTGKRHGLLQHLLKTRMDRTCRIRMQGVVQVVEHFVKLLHHGKHLVHVLG
ncbi:hypothetical protein D3C76_1553470 [compost metagenome]